MEAVLLVIIRFILTKGSGILNFLNLKCNSGFQDTKILCLNGESNPTLAFWGKIILLDHQGNYLPCIKPPFGESVCSHASDQTNNSSINPKIGCET